MPDWLEILRERIGALGLEPRREAEILRELASHHEDLFEEWRRRGLSGEEAVTHALGEVSDWQELRREILSAESEEFSMNQRTRSIWLPGLMTGTLAWGLFWLLETAGAHPRILWMDGHLTMFFLPWTLSLPIIGGLGAYVSQRRGGKKAERLLVGLFPSVSFTLLSLLGLAFQVISGHSIPPLAIAVGLLGWVIVPTVALLIGVLPFVVPRRQGPSSLEAGA